MFRILNNQAESCHITGAKQLFETAQSMFTLLHLFVVLKMAFFVLLPQLILITYLIITDVVGQNCHIANSDL